MTFAWVIGIVGGLALGLSQGLQAAPKAGQVIKLKPQIRTEALSDSDSIIPLSRLQPFLQRSLILEHQKEFDKLPYILSDGEGRALSGERSLLYVRGVKDSDELLYDIYRKEGCTYRHPKTKEILGFEAFSIGTAQLQTMGDPATFEVQNAQETVEIGARLAPSFATELPVDLKIKPSKILEEGYILSIRNMLNDTGVGSGGVVTISMGQREGLIEGHTLNIYKPGKIVADPMGATGWRAEKVSLPDKCIGQLLIFKTYEKLSLALILESAQMINLMDKVKS